MLLDELVEFVRHYKVVRKIEWLPYHTMGVFKYKELGLDYPLTDVLLLPGKDRSH